jgi:hypothetical protein
MIMGIDPGKHTGIAVYDQGKFINIFDCNTYEAILFLQENKTNIKQVIIESSSRQSHIWNTKEMNKGSFGRRARNTGSVDGKVDIFREFCIKENIEIREISPLQKGSKWTKEQFKMFVPEWTKQTNEHQRDAAKLVMFAGR